MLVLVQSNHTQRTYEPIALRSGMVSLVDILTGQIHVVDQSELARFYTEIRNVDPRA